MAQVTSSSSAKDNESAAALVEVASNPIIAGILGPNTDGRVRNPVPSKLKGKTDNKQGNFGVMHMGVTPVKKTDAAAERDAAARRTSENTAQRAKAAQTDKYVPPKKRGLDALLKEEATASRASLFGGRDDPNKRARPLAPDETKYEQARLLTLLRWIHPITLADQICKAVAYFGGIPGAPPPEDGIFPESANTKETGALFIGWLAEIFPDPLREPEVPSESASSGPRKRGRPSQNKGTPQPADRFSLNAPPNSANGYGYGPAVNPPSWGLPPSLMPMAPMAPSFLSEVVPVPPPVQQDGSAAQQNSPTAQGSPETPAPKQVLEDFLAGASSASKRRRGRPKGSRNKGKSEGLADNNGSMSAHPAGQGQATGQDSSHPEVHREISQNTREKQTPAASIVRTVVPDSHQEPQYTNLAWQSGPKKTAVAGLSHDDLLSPEERAVLEAFRPQGPSPDTSVVPQSVEAPQPKKRKRAPPKPKPVPAPAEGTASENPQLVRNANPIPRPEPGPAAMAQDALQWSTEIQITPTIPPSKRPRQRKPKAPIASEAPALKSTTSVVSNDTQPTAASTIPDSTAGSSQQSIPPVQATRPPADGLEAHYERFVNLQPQNPMSHTPTITPQQQIRQQHQQQQQQRTTSAPSVATAPQPQQQQMQRQKSQQGVQRDEQKMTQASVARSSSMSGFYNQQSSNRTQGYSQQYPSHQPSKGSFASNQASPQMSNAGYRSAASLTQASAAYSQAESTYRTASPRTNSQPQPSPSFSISDTAKNYRSTSTHGLAQPSPTYTQAESTYNRTGSTANIPLTQTHTQPSTTYSPRPQSQSQSQQQPSHQPSHQPHYSTFNDSPYIDLPTLESLGHSTSNSASNNMSASGYGQHQSVGGVGISRAGSGAGSNGLYGTSNGLNTVYDIAPSARPPLGTSTALAAAFDAVESQRDMRDQMIRGYRR